MALPDEGKSPRTHLDEALAATEECEKNYHIKQAIQLLLLED